VKFGRQATLDKPTSRQEALQRLAESATSAEPSPTPPRATQAPLEKQLQRARRTHRSSQ